MKTLNLIINWPLWCHMSSHWKTNLTIWQNMKAKGQKLQFSNFLVNWGKFGNAISKLFKNPNFLSLLWIGKNFEIYTAPDQHFKTHMLNLWMNWENVCPNLTFTVEKKMGNSHKRGWSHFKVNINDWNIPFPKILRIYQWIGKNIFHWEKWNNPIKLIR